MADLVLGLAKSAVEGTLTMAKSAIEEEAKLKKGVQRDLMLISDEFEMMHSVLNVAKDHVTDDVTRTLVRQVRNMALDVEDCIESGVHLEDKSNWWRRMLPSSCVPVAAPGADLDATVADVELLKARVEAMGHRNLRYSRIGDSSSKPGKQTQQQVVATAIAASGGILSMVRYAVENKSTGVDLATLINKKSTLPQVQQGSPLSASGVLRVISVLATRSDLGMTSIKKAYDDPETWSSFRCRAWVKLMHPFNPYEFMRSLLAQFYKNYRPQHEVLIKVMEPTEVMGATDGVLMEEFKKQMSNHKYLVVLEDVSTMVDWETVSIYLPDKNNGSCIVVHTQQLGIAGLCVGHPHRVLEIQKFSADHSVYVLFKEEDADGKVKGAATNNLKIAREWLHEHPLVGRAMDLTHLSFSVRPGRVVSVWGMSGVGKSFIVKHLYYKLQVDDGYPNYTYGWVNVSHPFDLRDLSWMLLMDLNPGYLQHQMVPMMKDPIQACRDYLHEHDKCFIVIDGLQSMEEWNSTKAALELGTLKDSCIILITNEENVAKNSTSGGGPSMSAWNVRGLEANHAIELFQKKVKQGTEITEEERRFIVLKCGGNPKVISAVAGMADRSWCRRNLVSALEENAVLIKENIEDLFAWFHSYFNSCPDFLKPCIFYLSIFPLNHAIRWRRLLRRFIAEGYARDNQEGTAEENGETSLRKLVRLSMLQVPPFLVRRPLPFCQVNGFLREYIMSRSMEENLVFVLDGHLSVNSQRTGRHLAIDKSWDRDRNVFESIDFSRLRSLTVFGEWRPFFVSEKMRLLRVLDLEDVVSSSSSAGRVKNGDVEQMAKLLPRLKFLSLRRCRDITRLPDSLGNRLKQLQTLDIRGTSVDKLPKSIIKLEKLQFIRAGATGSRTSNENDDASMAVVQDSQPPPQAANRPSDSLVPNSLSKLCLRHRLLDVDGSCHNGSVKVPRGIGKLSNLRTLGVVHISAAAGNEGVLEEIKNLSQLRKLGVSGISRNNSHKFVSAISSLAHLESLSLQVKVDQQDNQSDFLDGISTETVQNLQSLKLYGLVRKLPAWTKELRNLGKLSLQMTMLPQEGADVLVTLANLNMVRLFLSEFQAGELHFCKQAASAIRWHFLEISCMSRVQATIIFHDTKPAVSVLRIRCWRVASLRVSGLQHLQGLKDVWLSGPCDDAHKKHFESEVAKYPESAGRTSKPVFSLEEPGWSTSRLMTSW